MTRLRSAYAPVVATLALGLAIAAFVIALCADDSPQPQVQLAHPAWRAPHADSGVTRPGGRARPCVRVRPAPMPGDPVKPLPATPGAEPTPPVEADPAPPTGSGASGAGIGNADSAVTHADAVAPCSAPGRAPRVGG